MAEPMSKAELLEALEAIALVQSVYSLDAWYATRNNLAALIARLEAESEAVVSERQGTLFHETRGGMNCWGLDSYLWWDNSEALEMQAGKSNRIPVRVVVYPREVPE